MPIMRVSSSGVGACFLATAKASTTKNRMRRSRMARARMRRQFAPGLQRDWLDCSTKLPPSASPRSGLVWLNTLWSGEMTISTSSSSALVSLTGSGLSVMK